MNNSILNPFLDKLETSVVLENEFIEEINEKINRTRIKHNRKRGNRISSLVREARKKRLEVHEFLCNPDKTYTDDEMSYLSKLRANLGECGSKSLYRYHPTEKSWEFIAALTCKHKLCPVCNSERSKTIRRKYIAYFKKNPTLLTDYDFQHLTLTVPHDQNGFRGVRLYIDELIREFNLMRKKPFWKRMVHAGEFGIEVTRNENGLHIHIHALLLVKKMKQNRNLLHKEILYHWNRQTVDKNNPARELSESDIQSIKAGNKLIDDRYAKKLDTRGATFIGLENLYVINQNGKKRYVSMKDQDDFIKGLLECIKYHFEPFVLNKKDGTYDFDLLMEALPMIRGKGLYRKFGAFHGVKELNINDHTLTREEVNEAIEETSHDNVINPVTLKPAGRDEYEYVIMDAAEVFFIRDDNYKPVVKRSTKKLYLHNAHTMIDAMLDLISMSICAKMKQKKLKYQADVNLRT